MSAEGEWRYAIDNPLPRALRVGGGSALFLSGWIYHRRAPLRSLTLRLGDDRHAVTAHSMPRLDVYVAVATPGDTPPTGSYHSGFWAVLPLPGVGEAADATLALEAQSEAGAFIAELGSLRLLPSAAATAGEPEPGLVAVCMATYNPDLELFRRQVASLRAQSHERWRCVVSDDCSDAEAWAGIRKELGRDERFELHRNDERLGFYFNFERALELAPPEAEAVALCDQDDEWRPEKLATLLAALREGHTLVYSDQRIVGRDGEVLAKGYWEGRANEWRDLRALVVANTVTGAASLLRRDLLDVVLPFPPRLAGGYHDHWLALAARACGPLGFVDRPLYDYVQHDAQVLGHPAGKRGGDAPPEPRHGLVQRMRLSYFAHVVPQQLLATALLERCGARLRPEDRDVLAAFAEGDTSLRGIGVHARTLRALREGNDGDWLAALGGMAWRRWARWRAGRSPAPYADGRHSLDGRNSYIEFGPAPEGVPERGRRGRRRSRRAT